MINRRGQMITILIKWLTSPAISQRVYLIALILKPLTNRFEVSIALKDTVQTDDDWLTHGALFCGLFYSEYY